MGVSLTGPVNAQGTQWSCGYIPMNAQGDRLDCTVTGDEPGVQQDCVGCVCVYEGCRRPQSWVQTRAPVSTLVTASHMPPTWLEGGHGASQVPGNML